MARQGWNDRSTGRSAAPEGAEKASVRERTKAETREALIDAAAAEFGARGLDAPSLDAICARAGFTRGAFYVHFRDREDLVAAMMQRVLGGFLDAIIATGEEAHDLERTVRRFEDAVSFITQLRDASPRRRSPVPGGVPFHSILEACERSAAIRERFVALLREAAERVAKTAAAGQVAATVRRDVSAEALGSLLVTLALGFVASVEVGAPFDAAAARSLVLALLSPADGADAAGIRG
jgi:AcrR family transcriptional regulator